MERSFKRHIAIVSLLAAGFWAQTVPAALPFETAPAERRLTVHEQVLDGRVEAVHRATVSAQTSGRIVELMYDVDDFVEEGSVIVRLRDTEQRARLDQASAALREAEARFAEAQTEYERIRGIFERQLVSRAEMDRATAARDSARARLEAARAAVAGAEEQLEHTRIRAPYAGIVTERFVEVGESVSPGQPLMAGISLELLRVTAEVPQRQIAVVRQLGRARVFHDGETPVQGEDLTFFPYADPGTNTFRVRVQLPPGIPDLFPGMFVKVAFAVGERERLLVPESAVVHRGEMVGVYVVDDTGRVSLRQVRIGRPQEDDMIEVLAGLDEGEHVAVDPVHATLYLKEQQEAAR
ncbi:efflux transporter periplasmic adaptor subunit [Thioalkalivibrio denitrificans]|uniref:Efflux transporter periplasmic adaptor subunit n=1 Tax=Thioalkalivibrio denitrificans TaxID=108003 RepID=A0A1V3NKS6_9GAMM|nr:efflux RND transporter periplasmic adaptor subunit [Thioalkalivibrio denitrificans]OOG25594.1 efflux transporter periplasmic adaptor subunit [Thioalkalivibrio denitrificans]